MIKLLDCTLRDGGYINDWNFGYSNIVDIIGELELTHVDIIELGFLKNEEYLRNRTVFNDVKQIEKLIPRKKRGIEYAAMVEVLNPIPLDMIEVRANKGIDIIRVIVWKTKHDKNGQVVDALQEGFEYCKGIAERGYKLCVQPARVDQYSEEEFVNMLNMFQQLNPMAIYVVDSWGTQNEKQIMRYVELADDVLEQNIAIGYHGHNNLLQAFGTATTFVNWGLDREVIVDGSVYGIGRCAGNLNLELFAKYLNEVHGKNYDITPMINIYENCIESIYENQRWGYCMPYFLTAKYNCNPNYGEYLGIKKGLCATDIEKIILTLSEDDKIMYSPTKSDEYMIRVLGR